LPLAVHRARADVPGAFKTAVADFDYRDTSGEPKDQTAQHAARMREFDQLLRKKLPAQRGYRLVPLDCGKPRCSTTSLGPKGLLAAARKTDARLLVYGGIHKMSTLIQWGEVQVLDLKQDKVLLSRTFTFRGDTDQAFRRAAGFIGGMLEGVGPKQ
jgi:hypothetical protein